MWMMGTHVLVLLGFMLLLTSAVIAEPEFDLRQNSLKDVHVPCSWPVCELPDAAIQSCCHDYAQYAGCMFAHLCCVNCNKGIGVVPCDVDLCVGILEEERKSCCESPRYYDSCRFNLGCCPSCEEPKDICTDNMCSIGLLNKDVTKECCKYGKKSNSGSYIGTYSQCVDKYGCCPSCECEDGLFSIADKTSCCSSKEAYDKCTSVYDCNFECDSLCDNGYCCEHGMFKSTGGYTDRYQECIDSKCRPSCECENPPKGIELYKCCREGIAKEFEGFTDAYLECQKKYNCSPSCDCPADVLCPEELEKCCENEYTYAKCKLAHGCLPACDTLCDYKTYNDEKCCRHGMYESVSGIATVTDRYKKCSENGYSPCCECNFHVDEYTVEACCRDGIFDTSGKYTSRYEDCIKRLSCCVTCPCNWPEDSALGERCCIRHHDPTERHVLDIFHGREECRYQIGCFTCCECKEPLDEISIQECCSEGMINHHDGSYTDAYKRCQTKHGCCHCCECLNLSDREIDGCCEDELSFRDCKSEHGCCPKCGWCKFNGLTYRNGDTLDIKNCLKITCAGGTWITATDIDTECGCCVVRDDLHIIPYQRNSSTSNDKHYDWHGYCNYVLTQPGIKILPPFGISASFRPCFAGASCLHITTFMNSEKEIITFDHTAATPLTVMANGIPYTITSKLMIIPGTRILTVKNGNCFLLQGTNGILARICERSIQIYAHPILEDSIYGLCDVFTSSVSTTLTKRDQGTVAMKKYPNPQFPLSWLAPKQGELCSPKTDGQTMTDLCKGNKKKYQSTRKRCQNILKEWISGDALTIHTEFCARDLCACTLGADWKCNQYEIKLVRHLYNV